MQQSMSDAEIDEIYMSDDNKQLVQDSGSIDSRRKLEAYLEEKQLRKFLEDDYDSYYLDDDY